VLLCLYELRRACEGEVPTPGSDAVDEQHPRADAGATDAAMEALEQALLQIGFLSEDNPGHIMQSLRSVFGRAGLDERELRIVRGLARQVSWFAEGGREVALAKRKQGRRLR
jgi:tRNA/rRNA methyltransferase